MKSEQSGSAATEPAQPSPDDPSAEYIANWAQTLDESAREFYEERAGILQFCASLPRIDAERQAYELTLKWIANRH